MTPREIFRRYVAERKIVPPAGYRIEQRSGLTRFIPMADALEGIVMFAELPAGAADDAIAGEVEYFCGIGRDFEWKVYDFDLPMDLAARLGAHGFTGGDAEGFMVYPVSSHAARGRAGEARIERVTTAAGIDEIVAFQEEIWSVRLPWLATSLVTSLSRSAIYAAYVGIQLVGTGWIEFLDGSAFAELHGGAVIVEHRSRGIYTELFDIRLAEAQRRGVEFVAVDAAPMSRPILLAKGFTHVCDTVPFRSARAPAEA